MNHKRYFSDETCLSHEILVYLMEHPQARDTLDGIVEWWLMERKIQYQKGAVKMALADLAGRGFVLEKKNNISKSQYGLNESKRKEIQIFLDTELNDSAKE